MANLGKWGAIAGAGASLAGFGEQLRQQWLAAAQARQEEESQVRAEGRREQTQIRQEGRLSTQQQALDDRREQANIRQEDRRTANEKSLAEQKYKYELSLKGGTEGSGKIETWRSGDDSFKIENGRTYVLRFGSQQWEPIAEPGEAPPLTDELRAQADDYANQRVDERAGYFSSDATDFKDYEGSRTKAAEAFRQEFLQGRGASLDTPPAPATQSMQNLSPVLSQTRDSAQAAMRRGVSPETIIAILKQAGATDQEIQMMGL